MSITQSLKPVMAKLCQPCCKECPGLAVIQDKGEEKLAVVIKNASKDELTLMNKAGLHADKDETAGVVPMSVLKAFMGQLKKAGHAVTDKKPHA
jgi:hypothetical protein